ncbi:lamin tail domain-containing protein [Oceanotoga sp. DSM 15011]|uniref:lamin tail domain-containing protein n=1 Tax=Oceanotoga sp. DSM 15011 TaxID=2984951 RepID=UPI0021F3EECA|nr:lamin tail domain-containing protein [Oceanotoga sp. DSM 15011]UYO99045.1 lamin tail domain-containing protein [Oceanotoga sp. DSM 15011]
MNDETTGLDVYYTTLPSYNLKVGDVVKFSNFLITEHYENIQISYFENLQKVGTKAVTPKNLDFDLKTYDTDSRINYQSLLINADVLFKEKISNDKYYVEYKTADTKTASSVVFYKSGFSGITDGVTTGNITGCLSVHKKAWNITLRDSDDLNLNIDYDPANEGVYINEIVDAPDYSNEYIEIYNYTDADVDVTELNLLGFRDNSGTPGDKTEKNITVPLNTKIPAKGFLIVTRNSDKDALSSVYNSAANENVVVINSNATGNQIYVGSDTTAWLKLTLKNGNDIVADTDFISTPKKCVKNRMVFTSNDNDSFIASQSGDETPGELTTEQSNLYK